MPNEMMMDQPGAMPGGEMDMRRKEQLELVLTFLQNITPGDMSPEAAEQLMNMGRGLTQGGPLLDDNQVKALRSVVGARDRFPTEQMATFPQGNTNPDIMKDPPQGMAPAAPAQGMGAMSDREMQMRPQARPTAPMTSPRPQMRR